LTPGPTVTAVGPVATSSPAVTLTPSMPAPTNTVGATETCNPWPTFWPEDLEGPDDWGTMCPVGKELSAFSGQLSAKGKDKGKGKGKGKISRSPWFCL